MRKNFKTYEEQIELLKSKHLIIDNEEEAIVLLKKYSYFNLINGYKAPFKGKDGNYKKNTHFSDIYCLYQFDEKLRALLMKHLLTIELNLKSLISYYFCEEYTEEQSAYLNANNYNYSTTSMQNSINQLITILSDTISHKDNPKYFKHQQKQHNIPLWVLIKILTFGKMSKMYSLQQFKIQSKISHNFYNVNEDQLKNMLEGLTKYRNVCAHSERLFDYVAPHRFALNNNVYNYFYENTKNKEINLFYVFIILKYLLDEPEFDSLLNEFKLILDDFFNKTNQIQRPQLLKLMGFPTNWEEIRTCNK